MPAWRCSWRSGALPSTSDGTLSSCPRTSTPGGLTSAEVRRVVDDPGGRRRRRVHRGRVLSLCRDQGVRAAAQLAGAFVVARLVRDGGGLRQVQVDVVAAAGTQVVLRVVP